MIKEETNDDVSVKRTPEGFDAGKMRGMLVDYVTGLPTLNFVIDEIKALFPKNSAAVISVNISSIIDIEKVYGYKNYDELIKKVAVSLNSMKGQLLRKNDFVVVMFPASSHFIILLSSPRNKGRMDIENLENISRRILESLKASVPPSLAISSEYINFSIGYSIIGESVKERIERCLFTAIREAEISGINIEIKERQKIKEDIKNIIVHEEVRTVFQPIVSMADSDIVAYEALTRGPKTSKYEMPVVLFTAADNHGFSEELEWLCIAKSMINFSLNTTFINKSFNRALSKKSPLLFLNIDPKTFKDTNTIVNRFSGLVSKYSIDASSIVLEITERTAIADFNVFNIMIAGLKNIGFNIAIDDAGAGYSSLQSIAELKPKYLKFDMVLVRDIDKDYIKQELLKTLLEFANKTASIVIAEGIETEAEYRTVKALGVHLGQGYYFAKPSPQFIEMVQIL